jgi:hypothetical protein
VAHGGLILASAESGRNGRAPFLSGSAGQLLLLNDRSQTSRIAALGHGNSGGAEERKRLSCETDKTLDVRLDEALWRPTALGLVGPWAFLSWWAQGTEPVLYAPLDSWRLREPPPSLEDGTTVREVTGRGAICDVPLIPATTPPAVLSFEVPYPDEEWFAVLAGSGSDLGYAICYPWPVDPRIEMLAFFFVEEGRPAAIRNFLFLHAAHRIAIRGRAAVVTSVRDPVRREKVLRGGFFRQVSTACEEAEQAGIAPARPPHRSSLPVLARVTAVVDEDVEDVTSELTTPPGSAEAAVQAERELFDLCRRICVIECSHFGLAIGNGRPAAQIRALAVAAGGRFRERVELTVFQDGITGWGCHPIPAPTNADRQLPRAFALVGAWFTERLAATTL